jgi:hypothetical protein
MRLLRRVESRLFCTMKPKSTDIPWLQTVALMVLTELEGDLRSLAAKQIGHCSMTDGISNFGIPLTNRCISESRRKLRCPSRWCQSMRRAGRVRERTMLYSGKGSEERSIATGLLWGGSGASCVIEAARGGGDGNGKTSAAVVPHSFGVGLASSV